MASITVRILKNGKIFVETHGMSGSECVPYAGAMCDALDSVPLDLPESPQPVFDFSGGKIAPEIFDLEMEDEENRLYFLETE